MKKLKVKIRIVNSLNFKLKNVINILSRSYHNIVKKRIKKYVIYAYKITMDILSNLLLHFARELLSLGQQWRTLQHKDITSFKSKKIRYLKKFKIKFRKDMIHCVKDMQNCQSARITICIRRLWGMKDPLKNIIEKSRNTLKSY